MRQSDEEAIDGDAVEVGRLEGARGVPARVERVDGVTVDDMSGRIAEIVDAISAGTGSVQTDIGAVTDLAERSSAATEQVSASAQETSASAQEIANSAESLSHTAEGVERIVSRVRLTAH